MPYSTFVRAAVRFTTENNVSRASVEISAPESITAEIITTSMLITDGRVHAHVAVSNEEATFGGHLEPGCEMLTFCVVTVAEAVDADFSQTDTYAGQRPRE